MFSERNEEKPISIIISTLAALSYNQETNLSEALFNILFDMDRHIEDREGIAWIQNPTDPLENFADKWETEKTLEDAFYEWLEKARDDFESIAAITPLSDIPIKSADSLGAKRVNTAIENIQYANPLILPGNNAPIRPIPNIILTAAHKQMPTWDKHPRILGNVSIVEALVGRTRWRSSRYRSGDKPIPKNSNLRFRAKTNVPKPYEVFWQVTNTGPEATMDQSLRGEIDTVRTEAGGLIRKESTSYAGSHSIECFIVKDGFLAARSGDFVVNIE